MHLLHVCATAILHPTDTPHLHHCEDSWRVASNLQWEGTCTEQSLVSFLQREGLVEAE